MAYSAVSTEHLEIIFKKFHGATRDELSIYIEVCRELARRAAGTCPRPDLVGKIIYKPFDMDDGTVRCFTGRIGWDNGFIITYDDNTVWDTTVKEIERYRMTLRDCFDWIEVSGGRHKSFGKCLKLLTDNNVSLVKRAYRSLGLAVDMEHPWPCLGTHEFEKVENAKKIIEYVFCN